MHRDSAQFGSFEGLDNRRELWILFHKLGEHLPAALADQRRADFLHGLIRHSMGAMAAAPLVVRPCDPVGAYHLFVAICGVLEVPIDAGARLLDEEVRRQ